MKNTDKIGIGIYALLLAVFIVGLIYWGYISEESRRIATQVGPIYFTIICIGIYSLSVIYYRRVEKIFYPETKAEMEIKQKKKYYKKKYPRKIAFIKIDILDKQSAIKRRKKEINKLEKKIKDWEKKCQ